MKKLVKVSILFASLTLFGKVLAFLKEILVVSYFGVGQQTDALSLALSIPSMLYSICASAILITFIPNFCEVEMEEGQEAGYNFANGLMFILLAICTGMVIIGSFFAKDIVSIIAPGMDEAGKALTSDLIKISLVYVVFMVINAIFSSVLRSKDKYIGASFMMVVTNIPLLLYLLFFNNNLNIYMVMILTTLGYSIQFVVLIPELRKIKYKFSFKINLKKHMARIKGMVKAMIPMMIGLSVLQISHMVDKTIGSTLQVGSITSIELSNKIVLLIYTLLASCITTIFAPDLSKKFLLPHKGDWLGTIGRLIKYMVVILIPIAIGTLILNKNIIEVLYGRGKFGEEEVLLVSLAFMGSIIQLPFLAMREVLGQGFYSMKNTKVPALMGSISVVLNIVLTIVLSKTMGVLGITFATSISIIVNCILLINALKKRYKDFDVKDIVLSFIKGLTAGVVMGSVVYLLKITLLADVGNFILIPVAGGLGVLVYLISGTILKIKEMDELIELTGVKIFFKRNK